MMADPVLYTQYRQHAFPLWRQAFEAGSVDALQVWLEALNSGGFQFFAGVLPPEYQDVELAEAMMIEAYRAQGLDPATSGMIPPIRSTIDPETARRARVLFERHFRDSPDLGLLRERIEQQRQWQASFRERRASPADHRSLAVQSFNRKCTTR